MLVALYDALYLTSIVNGSHSDRGSLIMWMKIWTTLGSQKNACLKLTKLLGQGRSNVQTRVRAWGLWMGNGHKHNMLQSGQQVLWEVSSMCNY